MSSKCERILEFLSGRYKASDYPTLEAQFAEWSVSQPLAGLRVLDVTPLFCNTLLKHRSLIAAGAQLTVGLSDFISADPRVVEFCRMIGIGVTDRAGEYDLVLDCAAAYSSSVAKIGYVELTRSGVDTYTNKGVRCYVADSSRIKRLETELGTGESFFRAMAALGFSEWNGRKLVVFGSGKVGRGIVKYGVDNGALVTVVTDPSMPIDGVALVDYRDRDAVDQVVSDAYCAVMATGVHSAFERTVTVAKIIQTPVLLANMGAEDEFGESLDDSRVLCGKRTVNFTLDEPTHLRYIDATMSLHNYGAVYLAQNPAARGVISPDHSIEEHLLQITRCNGTIL